MAFTFCLARRRDRATGDEAKTALVAAALALGIVICPGHAGAQPQEREVYVSVVNEAGVAVSDLVLSDFVVRSDGAPCEVVRVSRATTPVQIALLVDTSQAVEPYVTKVRSALKTFSREIQDRHERALFALGAFTAVVANYSHDPMDLEAGIANLFGQPRGGASVSGGILEVLRGLRQRGASRPVIVLITPEGFQFDDDGRRLAALGDLQGEAHVTFYSIVAGGSGELVDVQGLSQRRVRVSHDTEVLEEGQDRRFAGTPLEVQMKKLAEALNNQYLVVYSQSGPIGPTTTVDVEVRRHGLTIRATPAPQNPGVTCNIVETNTSRGQEFSGYQCR